MVNAARLEVLQLRAASFKEVKFFGLPVDTLYKGDSSFSEQFIPAPKAQG